MDCRIQVTQTEAGLTVRLAGRLDAPHVCELLRVCADTSNPLWLDLAHLRSIDLAGVHALRRLRSEGVNLIGADRCIRRKLGPIRWYGVTGARL
jgi:anti-anti-sigma regulatory factor